MAKKAVRRRATVRVTRKPVDADTMGVKINPVKAVKKRKKAN